MRMEEMIEELETKEAIADVLDRFSPYLQSLSSGMVDRGKLAEKFSKYARVISIKANGQIMGLPDFIAMMIKTKMRICL